VLEQAHGVGAVTRNPVCVSGRVAHVHTHTQTHTHSRLRRVLSCLLWLWRARRMRHVRATAAVTAAPHLLKHSSRKSLASGDRCSGSGGGSCAFRRRQRGCHSSIRAAARHSDDMACARAHGVRPHGATPAPCGSAATTTHLAAGDLEHGRHGRGVATPGRRARGHLNHGAAEGPDVCGPAVPRLLDDLWRHPVGRAADGLGAAANGGQVLNRLGRTKVSQLHSACEGGGRSTGRASAWPAAAKPGSAHWRAGRHALVRRAAHTHTHTHIHTPDRTLRHTSRAPVLSIRMLAPFTSRCMMPLACRYSRPRRTCVACWLWMQLVVRRLKRRHATAGAGRTRTPHTHTT
jgi:hypothetical protein